MFALLSACSPPSAIDDPAYSSGASAGPNPSPGAEDSVGGHDESSDGSDGSDGALDYGEHSAPGPEIKFDTLTDVDAASPVCIECGLIIASQQSGAFEITGDNVFATASLAGEIVYAIGDYGGGRFIASADSTLPFNEITNCPLHAWLAGVPNQPKILQFGWTEKDGPINFVIDATVAGVHLPPEYINHPELLAHDYDIVMYLEAGWKYAKGDQPSDAEIQTLLDYVGEHGGGLYVVSEFADPISEQYLSPADLASVNRLMMPMGVEAMQVNLDWGDIAGHLDFNCFPTPVG